MSGSFSHDDSSAVVTDSFTHCDTLEVLTADQETALCCQGEKMLCVKAFVKMSSALEKEGCLLLLRTQFLAAFFKTHAHTHAHTHSFDFGRWEEKDLSIMARTRS